MSTRKIKDAKDLSTNELIYFKGHAQATYMSNGYTVEEAINECNSKEVDLSEYYTKTEIDEKKFISKESLNTIAKPYFPITETGVTISPNTYNVISGEISMLEVDFDEPIDGIINEYFIEFTTISGTVPTISFNSDVKWVDGVQPDWLDGYTYQVSIVNNLGVVTKFK